MLHTSATDCGWANAYSATWYKRINTCRKVEEGGVGWGGEGTYSSAERVTHKDRLGLDASHMNLSFKQILCQIRWEVIPTKILAQPNPTPLPLSL